ncbi:hypothetical protein JCM10212_004464 [Sporobolomyces blumeae]
MTDSNLRPLTLPSLSPALTRLSDLKRHLASLDLTLERYAHLSTKLDGFTDEPVWDAYIPFGPLAFFPGTLVHTNDITQTIEPRSATDQGAPGPDPNRVGNERSLEEPVRVLRSAKQAREQVVELRARTTAEIESTKAAIRDAEEELKKQREEERKSGKAADGGAATLGLGDDEDWSVNERGEVINEDGLRIFDIHEDLPPEPEVEKSTASSSSSSSSAPVKKPMRYLVKKGGKQVVRPLGSPSSPPSQQPPTSGSLSSVLDPSTRPDFAGPRLDTKSILDELEAEETAERERQEQRDREEQARLIEEDEAKVQKPSEKGHEAREGQEKAEASDKAKETTKPFAGFSAGFLSKSKQKRPSNSLTSPPASTQPAPPPALSPLPAPAPSSVPSSPAKPSAPLLKSSLSRSNSRSASPAPGSSAASTKKSVAFDLPVPDDRVPTREMADLAVSKKQPIILGMGPTPENLTRPEPTTPQREQVEARQDEAKAEPFVRPIKDLVVEKPLRKPVPSGGGVSGEAKKKVSRFRQMKDAVVDEGTRDPGQVVDKGKGKERVVEPSPPEVTSSSSAARPADPTPGPGAESMPAPIHTISLSSKPSPSSSTSTPRNRDGTISYADIPFGSDEEDEDEDDPTLSSEDEGLYRDDDDSDDFDDEDFDVDAALHQREVALAYHRQRLEVGAGRGTGPLGGFHSSAQGPFGDAVAQQGVVPADATLDSLSSPLTHAAALGKPSRFRTSNPHLESASLIIPSLLANDPSLTKSHTMLGPAAGGSNATGADELRPEEEERMRRTLEALAEGRPLPEDEQRAEREKEIALRGEYAEEQARQRQERERERERTAGKAPPVVGQVNGGVMPLAPRREAVKISVPENVVPDRRSREEQEAERRAEEEQEEAKRREREAAIEAAKTVEGDGAKPKRMSRFRQKQLGLLD